MGKQEQKTAKTLTMRALTGSRQTVSTLNGEEQKRAIGKKGKKFRYTDFNTARNLSRHALFLKNPKFYIGA
jgi:hypothetical protein